MHLLAKIIILLSIAIPALGQDDPAANYILRYSDIAVTEMHRSGIPASITLAQGIYESGYGLSESALQYNNHFGIKCKKEWTGNFYYKEDDDRDAQGRLIASCFRAYTTPEASYRDHTDFLMERERYAVLFTYSRMDYVQWAHGLKACGYATNPAYATKLIDLIERYGLWQFDHSPDPSIIFVNTVELAPVPSPTITTVVHTAIDTVISVPAERMVIESLPKSNTQGANRVNAAIILPANYVPKSAKKQ